MLKKRADTLAFFHEMERNIKSKFTNGSNQKQNLSQVTTYSSSSSPSTNTSSIDSNTINQVNELSPDVVCNQQNQQMNQYFDLTSSSSSPFQFNNHHYLNTLSDGSNTFAISTAYSFSTTSPAGKIFCLLYQLLIIIIII